MGCPSVKDWGQALRAFDQLAGVSVRVFCLVMDGRPIENAKATTEER
jgi:hypothetical protein